MNSGHRKQQKSYLLILTVRYVHNVFVAPSFAKVKQNPYTLETQHAKN